MYHEVDWRNPENKAQNVEKLELPTNSAPREAPAVPTLQSANIGSDFLRAYNNFIQCSEHLAESIKVNTAKELCARAKSHSDFERLIEGLRTYEGAIFRDDAVRAEVIKALRPKVLEMPRAFMAAIEELENNPTNYKACNESIKTINETKVDDQKMIDRVFSLFVWRKATTAAHSCQLDYAKNCLAINPDFGAQPSKELIDELYDVVVSDHSNQHILDDLTYHALVLSKDKKSVQIVSRAAKGELAAPAGPIELFVEGLGGVFKAGLPVLGVSLFASIFHPMPTLQITLVAAALGAAVCTLSAHARYFYVKDDVLAVRAVKALAREVENDGVRSQLVDIIGSTKSSANVLKAASVALEQAPGIDATKLGIELAASSSNHVQKIGLGWIMREAHPDAREAVSQLIDSSDQEVRVLAYKALKMIDQNIANAPVAKSEAGYQPVIAKD